MHGRPILPPFAPFVCILLFLLMVLSSPRASPGSSQDDVSNGTPQAAAPLVRDEVEFFDGATRLRGTLIRPSPPGTGVSLVLLGGSDRSARGPLKSRLAERLALAGVAVLTYDSPGTGGSGGDARLQSKENRAREALAAARFLREAQVSNTAPIGLLGGSEGASVALLAAGMDENIAFVIAQCGAFGLSMPEISRHRIERMGHRRHLSETALLKAETLSDLLYALLNVGEELDWPRIEQRVSHWDDATWETWVALVQLGRRQSSPEEFQASWDSLRVILRGWSEADWFDVAWPDRGAFDRLLALDASTFLAFREKGPLASGGASPTSQELDLLGRVRCPLLALWGEEDDFVPSSSSSSWLRRFYEQSGHPDATFQILDGASHFLTTGGAAEPFVDGYPEIVFHWLRVRFEETEKR